MKSTLLLSAAAAAVAQGATINQSKAQEVQTGTCAFPHGKGMVAVQTEGKNAGWAMHSDQECKPGTWCPYACPAGQLMGQWNPQVTAYTYPGSMEGGLFCDESGNLQTPYPDKPYCYDGKGTVIAENKAGADVAFCQTVLPGNEEMLIPTLVGGGSSQTLAVPGTDYWAGTAAHYYVNPPGVSVKDACIWGTKENARGNWAPYVTGANQDAEGNTFVTVGWNPIYLEPETPFRNVKPSYGLRIVCDNEEDCVGLPCGIDPSVNGVNEIQGSGSTGAGGANFCVVTAKKGAKARVEVFSTGGNAKRSLEHTHNRGNLSDIHRTVTTIAMN
ncbi:AEL312Cp [Eremothecium gossypii ATCC 10895]|uniref:AEL312Cp n=1 Tax=Eremothecium gossypii (strain ATCC 10895 / CBS 109.51 / FGSC 9923 / NRRL Y-1056) TaxID=284811 RepID=Q758R5_EREGS|nr:AEL312Cp [Eremothecium gossypii ATCC 10895]AAS52372.1 AEL312Cp [Eremothecium gossypii ATCC 10895]AEY96669.1 FAEL312Cp [Eremothecium gossypii FDAG1]